MDKLIDAQSDSTWALAEAMATARNVISDLSNALPDWQDVKDEDEVDEIKTFVGKRDLPALAVKIQRRAEAVEKTLNTIAKAYDQIIKDTTTASDASEQALAGHIQDQAAIRAEVVEAEAESARLESLVTDLKEAFKDFEAKAKAYERRAETAESRAFIMQIIKIGVQVISPALPAIAMALGAGATGGTSVIAANTLSTLKQATGSAKKKDDGTDTDVTAKVIKTKNDISKKKKEFEAAEKKAATSKDKVEGLRKDLKKAQQEAAKLRRGRHAQGDRGEPRRRRRDQRRQETPEGRQEGAEGRRGGDRQAGRRPGRAAGGLKALADGLGELSQEQKDEAANLRELQMKMLDKAEAYEKERREQAANLVKINALLKGKLSKEETIKLAIKSLNISISALKRTKEIVEEIAFFFKSFADFMHQVAEEAKIQIDLSESVAASATLRKSRLADTIRKTDEFFIRQAGEWQAARLVSERFNHAFDAGHSKLNKLRGTYITGDELRAYLADAAVRLREIADAREAAAKARIADLAEYRRKLRDDLVAEDVA